MNHPGTSRKVRPELQNLIDRARAGELGVQCVMVTSLSRLSRQAYRAYEIAMQLREAGVAVFVNEMGSFVDESPAMAICAATSEMYRQSR